MTNGSPDFRQNLSELKAEFRILTNGNPPWKGLDSEILELGSLGGVDVGGDCRTTHHFMSLLPNTALSGEAKRNDAPINWYLPTIYAVTLTVGADVDGFAQAASVGKPFMPDFQRCQKIYVPINDGAFNWFLFIVNVKEGYGEVWDTLPDGRSNRKREKQAERIFFRSGEGVPKQPNGFDCGIYVIKFMETPGLIPNKSYMHDSQDVRGRLEVQLIDSTFNEARAGLLAPANITFAEHATQARAIPSTLKANTYRIGVKALGKDSFQSSLERIRPTGFGQPVCRFRSRALWNESGLLGRVNRLAGFVPKLSGTNPANWLARSGKPDSFQSSVERIRPSGFGQLVCRFRSRALLLKTGYPV
ncbi:hypothetical protein WN943_019962 [Citrus x changshan-huyou]